MKTPAVDTDQAVSTAPDSFNVLMTIHRRNIEALLKAQQVIMAGNKTLMEHQIECFRSTMEQTVKAAQGIMQESDVKANFRKCCENMKALMQGRICNSNILSEVSARSNGEAAQIIQNRIYEALDESGDAFDSIMSGSPHDMFGWMTLPKS